MDFSYTFLVTFYGCSRIWERIGWEILPPKTKCTCSNSARFSPCRLLHVNRAIIKVLPNIVTTERTQLNMSVDDQQNVRYIFNYEYASCFLSFVTLFPASVRVWSIATWKNSKSCNLLRYDYKLEYTICIRLFELFCSCV